MTSANILPHPPPLPAPHFAMPFKKLRQSNEIAFWRVESRACKPEIKKATVAAFDYHLAVSDYSGRCSRQCLTKQLLSERKHNFPPRRMRHSALEKEKQAQLHEISSLESKLSVMQHEQDVIVKLKEQALGSSHHQVRLLKGF